MRNIFLAQLEPQAPNTPSVSLEGILNGIANASFVIFTAIVVVCFIIAGVLFLTSQGDPAKVKTARSAFIWGIAGIVVGLASFGITTLIASLLA